MKIALLWLLLSADYNGQVVVVERFKDLRQCQFVQEQIRPILYARNMPLMDGKAMRCVQAEVVIKE